MAEFDVIIIGGGISGALVAYALTRGRGVLPRVLLLEAGLEQATRHDRYVPPDTDERLSSVQQAVANPGPLGGPYEAGTSLLTPAPALLDSYFEHTPTSRDFDAFADDRFRSNYERRVGGTTWHWLGLTPRLIPSDFRMQSTFGVGVDWPLGYDNLEAWYTLAEKELGVSGDHADWDGALGAWRSAPFPMTEVWPSYSDGVVREPFESAPVDDVPVRVRTTPAARNSRTYEGRPACEGNSSCIPLCPIGAKYDATVHLAKLPALGGNGGVERRYGCVATRLVPDATGRITMVHYASVDKPNERVEATARLVVLACNAIETPRLWLHSGLDDTSKQVGRNLMDHLNRAVFIEANTPMYGYRGPPTTSGIDAFRDGAFRRERAAFRISIGNDGAGRARSAPAEVARLTQEYGVRLTGAAFRATLRDRVSRLFRLSCLGEVLPVSSNRVTLGATKDAFGIPRPLLVFRAGDYELAGLNRAEKVLRTLLSRVGDSSSLSALPDPGRWDPAGHILGTMRMASNASDGVVDASGRSFAHPNVYLADGSVFPTSGTANPTITIAAWALRLGSHLLHSELPKVAVPASAPVEAS